MDGSVLELNGEPMKQTASIDTEGAKLVFDLQGAGEPLLVISGAGGDATAYDALAKPLSDQFAAIIHDRRCNGRSSGDAKVDLDMTQQVRDAIALLRAAGYERAVVFGNSGGANIALQLAAEASRMRTDGLPAAIRLFCQRSHWVRF